MSTSSESISRDHGADAARDIVGSLEKGLAVMEIIARHPSGLTLTETARQAGLTRAGSRRLLLTLVASGYAVQEGREFKLSAKLIALARQWVGNAPIWTFARPFMQAVSDRFNESCSAAVLSGEEVVYVARAPGRNLVNIALHVGTRLPAYCTSMGRVLLSGLDPASLTRFLENAELRKLTARTETDRERLRAAIEDAGEKGYAIVDQELEQGLRSIAVPIRDQRGGIVAAINVSTQSARLSVREMEREILPLLKDTAHRIEDYFSVQ